MLKATLDSSDLHHWPLQSLQTVLQTCTCRLQTPNTNASNGKHGLTKLSGFGGVSRPPALCPSTAAVILSSLSFYSDIQSASLSQLMPLCPSRLFASASASASVSALPRLPVTGLTCSPLPPRRRNLISSQLHKHIPTFH